MKIQLAAKSIIPSVYKIPGGHNIFELMLQGIVVQNEDKAPAVVEELIFSLYRGNDLYEQRILGGKNLRQSIKNRSENIKKGLINFPQALNIAFSKNIPSHIKVSNNCSLKSGESIFAGIFVSLLDYVPNKIAVTVIFNQTNKTCRVERSFLLREYKCKNKYILPLKGAVACLCGPAEGLSHHRSLTSQEFAFDFVPLSDDFKMLFKSGSSKNKNFHAFNKKVIAPAAGTIVFARDGIVENDQFGVCPPTTREKIAKHGFLHAISGNIVIIDHGRNEYSFMAHLSNGSVRVVEGQKVAQGHVVGLLGNTGNSTAPHLHYHLMDGPDFLTARSLPIQFSNIIISPWIEEFNRLTRQLKKVHASDVMEYDLNGLVDPIVMAY
ncbi:MAG: hypothetical protein A2X28_08435 [Elusimicrobia bacterium GWA2_56_46]|nr:MAG: hypothetical protein A2X28_08435 [Elusimicrobia bacterium GWA2_56_46]OGR55165.1 MAG: hypothetical protein A2X39_01340 [Elusimicrobia bacterium GWC2_56_31]HBW23764.1 hypothetical protein [Elusimicrobiota bacterium]